MGSGEVFHALYRRSLGKGHGGRRESAGVSPVARGVSSMTTSAKGQGIKYCCSLGHEGHRLAPAAQRAGARALRAWLQAPQQVHRPAPPPRMVLGSRGRESPRGSSEDEPPQARQHVLPPAVVVAPLPQHSHHRHPLQRMTSETRQCRRRCTTDRAIVAAFHTLRALREHPPPKRTPARRPHPLHPRA